MDKLLGIRLFCCIADQHSFVAAANRFNLSPTMVSKHIQALERSLGTRLLNRTSRHVSLTGAGTLYFEQTRQMLETLDAVEAAVSGGAAQASGMLKLSAPEWLANPPFVELLAEFQARHPQVQLNIDLSGRLVNLIEENYDLALRITFKPEETMIARPLAQIGFHLVGAPAYLEQHGRPSCAADISKHKLLWYSSADSRSPIIVEGPHGKEAMKIKIGMYSSNETLLHLAVVQGMGLAFLPAPVVARDIQAGRLQTLLPDYIPPNITLYLMYPSRKYLSAKVRSFIDFLYEGDRFAAAVQPLRPAT